MAFFHVDVFHIVHFCKGVIDHNIQFGDQIFHFIAYLLAQQSSVMFNVSHTIKAGSLEKETIAETDRLAKKARSLNSLLLLRNM